jgi:hypothetical protein
MAKSSKGETYGIFKIKFGFGKYLDTLPKKTSNKLYQIWNFEPPSSSGDW